MPIAKDRLSGNALGGTELKKNALERDLDPKLLEQVQVFVSRVHEPLNPDKYRILWIQDLPDDPESAHLANQGWRNFHKIVFVSYWQMNLFILKFNIPWSRCLVLLNAVDPLESRLLRPKEEEVKIIYHTTPHRGLNLLLTVWDKLLEKHSNIHLDVFSSFKIYGWAERDKEFQPLFDFCNNHDTITYHGSQPNDVVRKAVSSSDIFAYPSVWSETSCMSLMEAMSAACVSVHPDFGALPETGAGWTFMYHWNEDPQQHASIFYHMMDSAIQSLNDQGTIAKCQSMKGYTDVFYSWQNRLKQWEALFLSIINSGEDRKVPKEQFVYRIGA